jgi:hypothetical protein
MSDNASEALIIGNGKFFWNLRPVRHYSERFCFASSLLTNIILTVLLLREKNRMIKPYSRVLLLNAMFDYVYTIVCVVIEMVSDVLHTYVPSTPGWAIDPRTIFLFHSNSFLPFSLLDLYPAPFTRAILIPLFRSPMPFKGTWLFKSVQSSQFVCISFSVTYTFERIRPKTCRITKQKH